MTTISRRSWHYRLYRYMSNIPRSPRYLLPRTKAERLDPTPPSSLCPYAWSIFLGLVGLAFLLAVSVPVAIVIAPFYLLFTALAWADGKVGLARLRSARAARAAKRREQRVKPRREPEPPPEKQPSLLAAYLRAKKDKVCPTIRLVD